MLFFRFNDFVFVLKGTGWKRADLNFNVLLTTYEVRGLEGENFTHLSGGKFGSYHLKSSLTCYLFLMLVIS